jgi:hypothetical protein
MGTILDKAYDEEDERLKERNKPDFSFTLCKSTSPAFIVIAAIVCFAIFIMTLYGIMLNLTKN